MMDKRTLLAISLSLLILLSWSALMSKFYPIKNQQVTKVSPTPTPSKPTHNLGLAQDEQSQPPSFQLSRGKTEVVFIEPQAAIKEVIFKDYKSYKFPLLRGLLVGDGGLIYRREDTAGESIKFIHENAQKRITEQFNFSNSNYSMELEITIENVSSLPIEVNLPLVLGVLDFSRDPMQARFQDIAAAFKDKTLYFNGHKEMSLEGIRFLSLRDRYCCLIVQPDTEGWRGFIRKVNPKESEVGLIINQSALGPGQALKHTFRIYLGPQELQFITPLNPHWSAVIYYGAFDFIAQLLLQLLGFLYRWVHNWGWVIVALSLIIYFLLFPLSLKQMRSMKAMQALQPAIEGLRSTYKDNPQKLNKEIMELYRKNKVNPFSGCLPMVLQIPIFFALYQVLIRSIALKGANFLWIKDLSEPDRLFILPVSLPILGNEINILPILMAIGMFIQQKVSLKTTSSGSAEQQKLMLILFPLMFGFIFYHMPAGLVLYWFINSTLMLIYQMRINR
jgi:YidC/Oxa1 family membrane protein insertase